MMRYKPPVDPTQAPWMSWREGNKTQTVCKHCLHYFDPYGPPDDNHYRWCPWVEATRAFDQQPK